MLICTVGTDHAVPVATQQLARYIPIPILGMRFSEPYSLLACPDGKTCSINSMVCVISNCYLYQVENIKVRRPVKAAKINAQCIYIPIIILCM